MRIAVWVLMVLFSVTAYAGSEQKMRVMTYNIFGVSCLKSGSVLQDAVIKFYGKRCPMDNWYTRNLPERMEALADRLKSMQSPPDIVLLQEAYTADSGMMEDGPVRALARDAGYPYYAWGPSSSIQELSDFIDIYSWRVRVTEKGVMSSGLLILSRYPLSGVHQQAFNLCADVDCKSNTGIQHVQVKLPELPQPVDIFNTHLQAFAPNEDIRIAQIGQLEQFVSRWRGNGVAVMGGDLNLRFNNQYRSDDALLKAFPLFRESAMACGEADCRYHKTLNPEVTKGHGLDHLLHSDSKTGRVSIQPQFVYSPEWRLGNNALSDHPPIIIDYLIKGR